MVCAGKLNKCIFLLYSVYRCLFLNISNKRMQKRLKITDTLDSNYLNYLYKIFYDNDKNNQLT